MPERQVKTIERRWRLSDNHMTPRRDDWVSFIKMYRSIIDKEKVPTRSNLFIPKVFKTIEQIIPMVVSAILGSDPPISVRPVEASDVAASRVQESLLTYQMRRQKFEMQFTSAMRDTAIMGTGMLKTGWAEETFTRADEEIIRYRGPKHVYVSPFEMFPDPHADDVQDAKYIMERYFIDREKLQSWFEQGIVGGEGLTPFEEVGRSPQTPDRDNDKESFLKSIDRGRTETDDTREWVEIIEYWEDDWVQFVANRNSLIRSEPLPFDHGQKPYHFFRDYMFGDEFFGIGEVENIVDLQHELNEKRNQRIDATNFSVNPIVLKSYAAGITEEEMVTAPGQTWTVTDVDEVQSFAIPDTGQVTIREEQLIDQDIKETTGVTDVIQGQATEFTPSTATGVNQLNQNASSRFQHKIRMFEAVVERLASQHAALNAQNMGRQEVIRIIGEPPAIGNQDNMNIVSPEGEGGLKFLEFDAQDIAGNFDFIAQGARAQTDQQRQRMLLQLMNVLGPFADRVNIIEILKRFMEALDIADVENIVQTQPQRRQQTQGTDGRAQQTPGPGAQAAPTENEFGAGQLGALSDLIQP